MNKRKLLVSIFSVLVLLVCAGDSILATEQLRITYNPMPFNLPSMVERELGLLNNGEFEIDYNTFLAGNLMSEAMAANDLDIAAVMGATSLITSKAGGRDIKVIAAYSEAPSGFALVSRSDGSLKLEELKGKRIAAPIGTEVHYLLGKILMEQGLSFDDIELVNMLIPDAVGALQAGQIDGAMAVEPVLTRLVTAGQIEVIQDGTGLISGMTFSVARGGLADEKIAAFVKSLEESIEYIADNPDESLELAASETDLPLGIVKQIAPKYQFSTEITPEVIEGLSDTIDFLYREGIISTELSVDDLF